jgi:hypothetical protein
MSANTVRCLKCGHANPITQMFCTSCGAKLDLSSVKKDTIKKERTDIQTLVNSLRALLRIGLILVLALLLWPVSPEGERGGRQMALSMNRKLESLRAAMASGVPGTIVLEEAEVNAYLASLTRADASEYGHLPVREAIVQFTGLRMTVTVVAALGPLPLSYQIAGVPHTDDGFSFETTGARIGHLPLLGPGNRLVSGKIQTVFAGLTNEREMMDRINRIALGDGAVELKVE